jgi:hypothetical protein
MEHTQQETLTQDSIDICEWVLNMEKIVLGKDSKMREIQMDKSATQQTFLPGIMRAINTAWDGESIKVDWLKLETVQRDIFEALKNNEITERHALSLINEAIAAFTRRDHPTNRYHIEWVKKLL